MLIELNYFEVRQLAKSLRKQHGSHLRHSELLALIAKASGLNSDAMMHALKSSEEARLRLDRNALQKLASDLSRPFISKVTVAQIAELIGIGDPDAPFFLRFIFRVVDGHLRMFVHETPAESVKLNCDADGIDLLAARIEQIDADYQAKFSDYPSFAYQIDVLAVPAAKYKEPLWNEPAQKRLIKALDARFAEQGYRYIPA
ncbi:hypothetical protein O9X98_06700 [Agrobacterium salinitolerans]|nr:hypothetical protein [Agrobacterium salinitolerans]